MQSPRKNVKRSQIQVDDDCDGADVVRPSKIMKTETYTPSFISSSPNKYIIKKLVEEESTLEEVVVSVQTEEAEVTIDTNATQCGLFSRVFTSLRSEEEDIVYNIKEDAANLSEVEESEEATSSSESISLCADADLGDDRTEGELSALADWGEEESESEPEVDVDVFNPYTFIKNLPARTWHSDGEKGLLPPREAGDNRICLVLDLDETLVHCSTEPLQHPDLVFPVVFNDVTYTVFARKRPYIEKFLLRMSAMFEIVVFTASQEVYADKLLNILDPDRTLIKHRLFRDSCVYVDNNYLKDLHLLGRDLSQTIIVDNSPQAFGYQIDNGIPIESWFDDDLDTELLQLSSFLESLTNVQDVRPFIRDKYKLHELVSGA